MLETLRIDDATFTRLPPQELRRMPARSGYSSQLYARDERVFEIFDNNVTVFDTLDPPTSPAGLTSCQAGAARRSRCPATAPTAPSASAASRSST
jgi:hypothetical protein